MSEVTGATLFVNAPPLYIQESAIPKALIDDLLRTSKQREHEAGQTTADLFADFNASPRAWTRPSSTSMTRTGPTA
ncbi:MAG: hypothetical protein R3E99_00375 [Burkholderiaceae bacterium]